MPFSFSVNKPSDITSALTRTARLIKDSGGSFSGNEQSGRFSGNGVSGHYSVGSRINITVTDKPFYYPKSAVEDRIRDYFRSA